MYGSHAAHAVHLPENNLLLTRFPLPYRSLPCKRADIISQRMATEKKVVVFMCGLPARGKSFISKKLTRYLRYVRRQKGTPRLFYVSLPRFGASTLLPQPVVDHVAQLLCISSL